MENGARDLLLDIAASAFEERESAKDADWAGVLAVAESHGLLPLAQRFYRRANGSAPRELGASLSRSTVVLAARSMHLANHLRRVLHALNAAGVVAIVLKGPALAHTVYSDPLLRPSVDLDLLCREEDWVAIHRTFTGLGFDPTISPPAPPPRVWQRKAYYHNQYFDPNAGILVEVHFDPWEFGLRPRLGNLFWERARTAEIVGVEARILSVEDQLLHLCAHLHHHSYSRLIWFTDIGLLLRRHRDEIDWRYVIKAARAEGVTLSVCYCLYYVERLLRVQAPSEVLRALRACFEIGSWDFSTEQV